MKLTFQMFAAAVTGLTLFGFTATNGNAADYDGHVIVVLDDTGTLQTESEGAYDSYTITKKQLIKRMAKQYGDDHLLTVLSLYKAQPVYQGSAAAALDYRGRGASLIQFVEAQPLGCADYMPVVQAIDDLTYFHEEPVTKVMFVASMLHTGPNCQENTADFTVPDEFFDQLAELASTGNFDPEFWWVYKTKDLRAWAREANLRLVIKGMEETIGELSR